MKVWLKLLIALILGVILGIFNPFNMDSVIDSFHFIGQLFNNSLSFLVIPVIFISLIFSSYSLRESRNLAKTLLFSILLMVIITLFSLLIAFLAGNLFQPGAYIHYAISEGERFYIPDFKDFILNIIPKNIFAVLLRPFYNIINIQSLDNVNTGYKALISERYYLWSLIFVSILLGITMNSRKKSEILLKVSDSFYDLINHIADLFIEVFPFGGLFFTVYLFTSGVFSLTIIQNAIMIIITIVISFLFLLIIYLLIIQFYVKINAFKFLFSLLGSIIIGFMTGNNIMNIVPTLKNVEKNLGVNAEIGSPVVIMSALLNRPGTLITAAVCVLAITQKLSMDVLNLNIQMLLYFTLFITFFKLDGFPELGFLVLIAFALQASPKLEPTAYAVYTSMVPLFSRLAAVFDTISAGFAAAVIGRMQNKITIINSKDFF